MPAMICDKVEQTIAKFGMIERESPVLVGLSGGADSVCLLLLLNELGYRLAAAHLNHGLRGAESDEDARFTKELAERLGLPFFSTTRDIRPQGHNLENAGRRARKEFFDYLAATQGFARIALGHTSDDRIETLFLNLLRGAGPDGLTSMEPVKDKTIRPLIETSRVEVESYLKSIGQNWRTDESNFQLRFARNQIRHSVIPDLRKRFNPNLSNGLARTIEILEDERLWMAKIAESWLAAHGICGPDEIVINCMALATEPVALQRRVIRTALKRAGSTLEDVSFDRIESARQLLQSGKSGKTIEMPGGFKVVRSFENLIVYASPVEIQDFEYRLQIPGEIHIPEAGTVFRCEILSKVVDENGENRAKLHACKIFADGGKLGPYVRIRNWKPGDYYRPVGLPAGKLKKLFQQARIPRHQRHRWPVVVMDSSIVWVASFPVSREFALDGQSQKIVAFEAIPI